VFIKFVTNEKKQTVLRSTKGQLEYRHEDGEVSIVRIDIAGMDQVQITNLPPEVPDRVLRDTVSKYGDVKTYLKNYGHECLDTHYQTVYV